MKVDLNPAFILHRRPYRETSILLDVFSFDHGRVSVIARGVRQKRNIRSEILQPYQRLQIAWSGKGELMTLTLAEADKPAYLLKERKLIAGFYLNELIIKMLHRHEAYPDLFNIYDRTLDLLSSPDVNEQSVLRVFEKKLLDSMGYGLILDRDINSGEKIVPDDNYYYQIDRGPAKISSDNHDQIKISGKTLNAIENELLDTDEILQEAKTLMRFVLNRHLGGKPLASRNLYKSYLSNFRINNT